MTNPHEAFGYNSLHMERRPMPELLDSDAGSAAEVAASFKDLRWFNRWFGGISITRELIEIVARKTGRTEFSLLEVASGEGYIPQFLQKEFTCAGIQLKISLVDRLASHLPKNGGVPKISGDALHMPFRSSSFDLVSSSLFVHHLGPEQAVEFAREALRVCTVAVLAQDLIRHPLHLALAYAGAPLYRSRITRNDAPASVRQAYTVEEMRSFFCDAGSVEVESHQRFLFRMGLIAWRHDPR